MLFLVMLLVSRMLSSLAGIKLKRLNHRQRMMDISKRVRTVAFRLGAAVAFWLRARRKCGVSAGRSCSTLLVARVPWC